MDGSICSYFEQELRFFRLLVKVKAVADIYFVSEEIYGFFSYCQYMIDLMDYMIRNR